MVQLIPEPYRPSRTRPSPYCGRALFWKVLLGLSVSSAFTVKRNSQEGKGSKLCCQAYYSKTSNYKGHYHRFSGYINCNGTLCVCGGNAILHSPLWDENTAFGSNVMLAFQVRSTISVTCLCFQIPPIPGLMRCGYTTAALGGLTFVGKCLLST